MEDLEDLHARLRVSEAALEHTLSVYASLDWQGAAASKRLVGKAVASIVLAIQELEQQLPPMPARSDSEVETTFVDRYRRGLLEARQLFRANQTDRAAALLDEFIESGPPDYLKNEAERELRRVLSSLSS